MDEVSANGRRRVYAVLAHLAACDGVIHPTERSYLDRFAALSEISAEEAAEIERASAQGRGLSIGKNPRERELLLDGMIEVIAADGILAPQEATRAGELAGLVGLDPEDLQRHLEERVARQQQTNRPPPPPTDTISTDDTVSLPQTPKPAGPSAGSRRRIYTALCAFAGEDGTIHPPEREWLEAFREREGISREEGATCEAEGLRGELRLGREAEEQTALLRAMLDLSAADGVLTRKEYKSIKSLAKRAGVELEVIRIELEERFPDLRGSESGRAAPATPPAPPRPKALGYEAWVARTLKAPGQAGVEGVMLTALTAVTMAGTFALWGKRFVGSFPEGSYPVVVLALPFLGLSAVVFFGLSPVFFWAHRRRVRSAPAPSPSPPPRVEPAPRRAPSAPSPSTAPVELPVRDAARDAAWGKVLAAVVGTWLVAGVAWSMIGRPWLADAMILGGVVLVVDGVLIERLRPAPTA